ncbi:MULTISPECIES: hypothetical protein [Methanobacterium]|uniref:Uncharacterized protein n=1 Tax=Methanobacterium bryantii TaxID=2161 RepID=A0A2A2H0F3_METBR|nr:MULTISPECIES: hypothetical protein [Methanobacterium]OEC87491.1 hypothetical protein A9507_07150 [Methanobacterium sp. A39]PAV02897.1 hypothetical protein ASJ80_03570 [Methanobacterium bryantii]
MNDDDKTIESMVEEYKMSMGGSFFNNFTKEPEKDIELEELIIKKGIDNHLFDTHELLSIYDDLSEYNKREFFQRVVVAFIKFKFQEDAVE